MEKDDKTGRTSVKKLGMAPVQRDGMEYEFTVFMDIEQNHSARSSKDRTDLFKDEIFIIDEGTGTRLMEWLSGAKKPADEKQTNRDQRLQSKKARVMQQLNMLGISISGITKEDVMSNIKRLTGIDMTDNNLEEISARLHVLLAEAREQAGGVNAKVAQPVTK